MTTLVTEPFTYSNGVLETVGSANWARRLTDDLAISSKHVVRGTSNGGAGAECGYPTRNTLATAAQWAQAQILGGTGAYSETGVVLRCATATGTEKTYYYAVLGSGGTAQLYSAVAGSYTELGNFSHGSANALVYAEAQGTAIKLFLNG